jgi:catechol 2,3-dioxygenase-like lactoylglutathione lyase family enzyme
VFDHVGIRASDRGATERFYDTVLRPLGVEKDHSSEELAEWGDLALGQASEEHPVTRNPHVGFAAPSRDHVDEFWRVGTEAGYRDDGPPGPRPQYSEDYYGAFLLDPDGNSAEAVHHGSTRDRDLIDHLWLRVADLRAASRFYEAVAPHAGYRVGGEHPDRVHFAGPRGSFTLVAGDEPTRDLHIAFPADTNDAVDAFHRALTGAGYVDNGAPGERAVYHPGYYGAFVLDPDGNNVELVNHNR